MVGGCVIKVVGVVVMIGNVGDSETGGNVGDKVDVACDCAAEGLKVAAGVPTGAVVESTADGEFVVAVGAPGAPAEVVEG